MKRTRFSAFAIFLIVALCSFCAYGCDGAPATNAEKDIYEGFQTFDVMSFNIRTDTFADIGDKNWDGYRQFTVPAYIADSGADVVCLQEVKSSQYECLKEKLAGVYNMIYYQRENSVDAEGLAILYTDDFSLLSEDRFWLSSTPDKESQDWGAAYKRISVNALLEHKESGLVFNVFTVHLDHISELSRENGLALILEKAEQGGYPALLCGDFNTNENSDCYSVIASKMQDCRKTATVTDSGLTFQNYGYVKQTADSLPIDFCFADNSFKVFEFAIKDEKDENGNYYSDHYAISAKIGLPLQTRA